MQQVQTITTKLGKTRAGERSRIWIEGERLAAAGFTVGERYDAEWTDTGLTLRKTYLGKKKVSGKGQHPIIDITGSKVIERFGHGTHVVAVFTALTISIVAGS